MRPSTRMMMISSLDENEREGNYRGNQNEGRRGRDEARMERGYQNGYDMPESRDGYEGRYAQRGNRRGGPEGGWDGETGEYEGRYESRMEMDEPESRRRRGNGRYAEARRRGGEMYSGRDDAMGFDMRGPEARGGGEDEWSGKFRGVSTDDEPEEKEPEEERLKKWVKGMKNADGTIGEHFKEDHTNLMRANHCPGCDKTEFYAAVNMMYSDYCEVAKRMGVDNPDFYGGMAKAFLMDKDAGKGKIAKYMKHVAGK